MEISKLRFFSVFPEEYPHTHLALRKTKGVMNIPAGNRVQLTSLREYQQEICKVESGPAVVFLITKPMNHMMQTKNCVVELDKG